MKKIAILIILIANITFAYGFDIVSEKTISMGADIVALTPRGFYSTNEGYLIIADYYRNLQSKQRVSISKVDKQGNIIWQDSLWHPGYAMDAQKVFVTDQSYEIFSTIVDDLTHNNNSISRHLLNSDGTIIDSVFNIQQDATLKSGIFLNKDPQSNLFGFSFLKVKDTSFLYKLQYDHNGVYQSKSIIDSILSGNDTSYAAKAILNLENNKYLVACYENIKYDGSNHKIPYLLFIDSDDNIFNRVRIPLDTNMSVLGMKLINTSDNSILLFASIESEKEPYLTSFACKLSEEGNIELMKDSLKENLSISAIIESSAGSYAIVGTEESDHFTRLFFYIAEIDDNLNIKNEKAWQLGTSSTNILSDIILDNTSEGINGYTVIGRSITMDNKYVIYFAKINNTTSVLEDPKWQPISIFPNPTRDFINTAAYLGWQYQIYDLLGSCVQSGMIDAENINVASLPTGFYTVRFFKEGKQVVEKLMKE